MVGVWASGGHDKQSIEELWCYETMLYLEKSEMWFWVASRKKISLKGA